MNSTVNVNGWDQVKSLKIKINLDLIEIFQFWWVYGWLDGSEGQWVGLGQMTKYRINLDLVEIIQFSSNDL